MFGLLGEKLLWNRSIKGLLVGISKTLTSYMGWNGWFILVWPRWIRKNKRHFSGSDKPRCSIAFGNCSIAEFVLTHWSRVTHICVGNLTIIGSDNGLSPGRRQTSIRTNAVILLIRTLGTNFSEIWSEIHVFSLKENAFESVVCEIASILSRPQCVNLFLWWFVVLVGYHSSKWGLLPKAGI